MEGAPRTVDAPEVCPVVLDELGPLWELLPELEVPVDATSDEELPGRLRTGRRGGGGGGGSVSSAAALEGAAFVEGR